MSRQSELAELSRVYDSSALSNRNLVINGAMNVAQRGTSSTSSGVKTIDRFAFNASSYDEAAFTQAQSSLAPSGFSKSYRIDCTTIESALAADEIANVSQAIEAQNLQHIQNGSSGAKYLTLSFWVKSNKTGAFTVNFYKPDNTARHISSTYTINSADTWEYKTITIAGDTDGGGIANDNGAGLYLYWILSAGSDYTSSDSTSWGNYANAGFAYGHTVNIFDNTANDWAVTGVQLEVGTEATPFEHRNLADELRRCQRYFIRRTQADGEYPGAIVGFTTVSNYFNGSCQFETEMRAAPSLTSSGSFRGHGSPDSTGTASGTLTIQNAAPHSCRINGSGMSFSGTNGIVTLLQQSGSAGHLSFDAEL